MSTIKEIAKAANVSRGTVDRVLNGRGGVNSQTEQRILTIAAAMNYTPNPAGKTLAIKKKHLKFGFILMNSTNNPFFLDVENGIRSRTADFETYGIEVLLRYTPIDDSQKQLEAIDDLVGNGISGLAITPINHESVHAKLRALSEAHIPVVTVNTDLPTCGRIAYVGSNYRQAGETAAGLMNLICSGTANVGIVAGSLSVLCHAERISGFRERCRQAYPGIRTIDTVLNFDDDIKSYMATRDLLSSHPKIDALYLVSAGVIGACQAVKDLGLNSRMRIISYDLCEHTRALLSDGTIKATIAQEPNYQGKKPLDILLNCLGMGVKNTREFYYTRSDIIIAENSAFYPYPS